MTPKEKAEQLFVKFNKEALHVFGPFYDRFDRKTVIKQCALIAVNEILDILDCSDWSNTFEYYQKVKQEIEKL